MASWYAFQDASRISLRPTKTVGMQHYRIRLLLDFHVSSLASEANVDIADSFVYPRAKHVHLTLPLNPARLQVTRKGQGRVPLPWLLPPRFGSLSPPALNYGGLGLALVAALARHAPVHNTWTECLAHLEPSVPLKDDDAAVRLALATEAIVGFVDHHSQLGRRQRLPGLEMMNEERLFFVGLCAGLCAKGDSLAPHRCHLAARNSPRFEQAFGCRAGSYMNPRQRCPYPSRHQGE